MAFRAADHRLDYSLREACAADIDAACGYEKASNAPALAARLCLDSSLLCWHSLGISASSVPVGSASIRVPQD